jgi:O-antigen/teichoic acid export membrane protein
MTNLKAKSAILGEFLHKLLARFRREGLARNMLELATGTAAGQVIALLALPIISRLYQPETYGVFVVFVAVAQIGVVIACGRYDLAIVLPRRHGAAAAVAVVAIGITFISVFVLALIGHVLATANLAGTFLLMLKYLDWVVLAILVLSFNRICLFWLTRRKQFRGVAWLRVQQVVGAAGLQILFAFVTGGAASGLIMGFVLSHLLATLTGSVLVYRSGFPLGWAKGGWVAAGRRLCAMARRFRQFPIFTVPAGLLNSFAIQSLSLVSAAFFPAAAVGHLGMGQRIGNAPTQFATLSIGQVVVQRLSENRSRGISNVSVVVQIVRTLFLVSVPFIGVLIWFGDDLFAFVFGENWRRSGEIIVMLLPIVVANFCVNCVSQMYIYERNRTGLVWQGAFMLVTTTSILVGGLLDNLELGVWAYSISGALMYVLHLALTLNFTGGSLLSLVRRLP